MSQIVILTDEFYHVAVLNDLDITITRSVSAEVRYMHPVPFSEYERFQESNELPFNDVDNVGLLTLMADPIITQPGLGEV